MIRAFWDRCLHGNQRIGDDVVLDNILIAFVLTTAAGLSTAIGGLIAFMAKATNRKFLSVCLGFSAGMMIYVSFVEIFPESQECFVEALGERGGSWAAVVAFFAGIALIALIDRFIPSEGNPHEVKRVLADAPSGALMRMGALTTLAISLHNFPEGMATFISCLQGPEVAIPIFVAISIHNIPEGIAIAVPIYQATGSRKKAMQYAVFSGLTEPLGALVGWLVLRPVMNDVLFGVIFAMVAGIMIFISLDELLPSAREYGEHHLAMDGLVAGMAVMALSLLLFM